ncbi:hypothetical protein RRG08_005930 [Elysia crispata]|uniref:Uncharacterized protein n=1 Tax=Elysia crispata TaxID=231223 RepID=A0AAE0Z9S1_9GAST|nr:hypothetical protein RRG08_005930 [Elysia crispata]
MGIEPAKTEPSSGLEIRANVLTPQPQTLRVSTHLIWERGGAGDLFPLVFVYRLALIHQTRGVGKLSQTCRPQGLVPPGVCLPSCSHPSDARWRFWGSPQHNHLPPTQHRPGAVCSYPVEQERCHTTSPAVENSARTHGNPHEPTPPRHIDRPNDLTANCGLDLVEVRGPHDDSSYSASLHVFHMADPSG